MRDQIQRGQGRFFESFALQGSQNPGMIRSLPMTSLRSATAQSLRRLSRVLRNEGVLGLANRLSNRLYYHHRSVCFEMPLDKEIGQPQTDLDVRLDFSRTNEVVAWIKAQAVPGTWDPIELARITERQQLIGGLYHGQELVGYTKLGWSNVYIMDYQCDLALPERDCMVLDSYIAPKMRGHGLGGFLVTESSREMQRRGFARRLSFVRTDNTAMLRVAEKVGYRPLGQVDFFIILRKKYFRPYPLVLIEGCSTTGT
jgi:GNAT superfamily N-acetyltransferase